MANVGVAKWPTALVWSAPLWAHKTSIPSGIREFKSPLRRHLILQLYQVPENPAKDSLLISPTYDV